MEIITNIGSKLGEYLVEGIINQARYLFCFNNIVKDLEDEEDKLKGAQESINNLVKREKKNTKETENDVAKWLQDVGDVTKDVEELKVKIQADKSCLKGWCPNWACRYWLGRKAAKKTIIMAELRKDRNNFDTVARLKSLPGIEFLAPSDFMSFEAIELASTQIIEALEDKSAKMVGLYGSGGVGKTTLAKNIGNILKHQNLFDDVVIVVISQNPDFKNIQNKLAGQLGLKFEEEDEENRAKRLYMRFIDPESKILLILDDVWKKHDLKIELGIPVDVNHGGCKILLTTRLQSICDQMGCNSQIPLGFLKPEEGLTLLRKYADIHDDDSTLIEVSKEVASECKGLPLAIAVVGSALRGNYDADEWKLVCHKLKKAKLIEIDGIDRDVYACLKWSYDYLRDEKAKFCFMLCSLYPEDHEIALEDLVRYGVGLDWYQDITIEEARSLLRGTINMLKSSSLLLETGKEGFVKMHDMVRDVAVWIGSTEKTFMSEAGNRLMRWPKDEAMGQYKAISLVETEIKELPERLVCTNLQILLLGSQFGKMEIPGQFFEGMQTLKIVTIVKGDLSLKSLQYLTGLQVLQLDRCRIREVAFLGELKTLQILCFKFCSFDGSLVEYRYELGELRLLEVSDRISPSLISKSSRLEEFYGDIKIFQVDAMDSDSSDKSIECFPKSFAFPKLKRYKINEAYDDYHSETANTLSMWRIEATLLVIFSALYQNLHCLHLSEVSGCQNIVPSIYQKSLIELTFLRLRSCEDLECVVDVSQHVKRQNLVLLSSLVKLKLMDLPKLQWIWKAPTQQVSLQNLTELLVEQCNNLTYLLTSSQARSLAQLKRLDVSGCERLNCVIEAKFDGNEGEKDIRGEDEITIVLPMLKELILEDLPNLTSFCSENYYSKWQVLQYIHLSNCPSLDISKELKTSVQYLVEELQSLDVTNCYHLRDAIPELLKHGLKKLELLKIERVGVEVVHQQLVEDFSGLSFSHSSSWRLCNLPELAVLYKDPNQHLSLENLTKLKVERCNNLTYLFTFSQARSLARLKSLCVRDCERLNCVIEAKFDGNEGEKDVLGEDENTIMLLMLRKLQLRYLPNLVGFCSENCHSTWKVLQEIELYGCPSLDIRKELRSSVQYLIEELHSLEVTDCDKMGDAIPALLKHGLKKLEKLNISRVGGVQVVFQQVEEVIMGDAHQGSKLLFPCLKELCLWGLPEVEVLYKDPAHIFTLQNLTTLDVYKCSRLTHVLSPTLAQNLLQLDSLSIEDCSELEQIIDEDDDDGEQIIFPNLTRLSVRHCPKLKRLFHISVVAPTLQKLKHISIWDNDELEEIFWHKDGEDVMDDKKIVMTQLELLELIDLPKLTNFFPSSYEFFLRNEIVINCPNYRKDTEDKYDPWNSHWNRSLPSTSKEDGSDEGDTSEYAKEVGDASK